MIEFDSLKVSWRRGEHPVLETGLFSVPSGVIPLLGVNGSGKTTFCLAAARLLDPPATVTGSVRFSNPPNPGPKVHYLPAVLSAELDYSVADLFKIAGASILPEIEPLEVEGLLHRGFRTLSAGEAQRVLIARALCIRPDLLILDEALSALDPEAFAASFRALQRYAGETGSTVIWVTHDWNLALELGQRFIWIEKGCVGSGEEGDALRGFLERSPKLACSRTERGGLFVHPTLEPFLRANRRSNP